MNNLKTKNEGCGSIHRLDNTGSQPLTDEDRGSGFGREIMVALHS